MAVQSIERIFASFRAIAQYLVRMGITKPSRPLSLHKIIVLRLGLIAEQVSKRLPNDYCISIDLCLSDFITAADNAFPQKLITITYLHLQKMSSMREQIQKLLTKEKPLCLIYGSRTAAHYWHNFS